MCVPVVRDVAEWDAVNVWSLYIPPAPSVVIPGLGPHQVLAGVAPFATIILVPVVFLPIRYGIVPNVVPSIVTVIVHLRVAVRSLRIPRIRINVFINDVRYAVK